MNESTKELFIRMSDYVSDQLNDSIVKSRNDEGRAPAQTWAALTLIQTFRATFIREDVPFVPSFVVEPVCSGSSVEALEATALRFGEYFESVLIENGWLDGSKVGEDSNVPD